MNPFKVHTMHKMFSIIFLKRNSNLRGDTRPAFRYIFLPRATKPTLHKKDAAAIGANLEVARSLVVKCANENKAGQKGHLSNKRCHL